MNELEVRSLPTHCPDCELEYQHIGHPFYPGATMMTVCGCQYETIQTEQGQITVKHPPKKGT